MRGRRGERLLSMWAALAIAGCETRTTTVRLADPAKVSISSGSAIVLAVADATTGDQRATLREDSFETEPGARAHYKIDVVRQHGEIALEWSARVPILNGEHQTLIDRNGAFIDQPAVVALISPDALQRDDLRIDACGELDAVSAKGASLVGYRATEWNSCGSYYPSTDSKLEAPFTVRTPWSNVVEIRDHTEVNAPGTIAIGVFGLGMTGGGVALIAVPKSCVGCVIGGAFLGLIGALTTITATLDLTGGPRDRVTYPPKSTAIVRPQ
ncbi:MAG: hypothetical protein ABI421_19675 [Polyangiaceae bacterium]